MVVLPGGNVGIGQFDDFPTITDKLQVFGDIRVGTTGTNGCVKDFGGNCARRHVRRRTGASRRTSRRSAPSSIGSPRCSPCTTSGARRNSPSAISATAAPTGLIAQDVEQVLPELVVTDERRLQGGRLQQAAAAHHPGRQGTEGRGQGAGRRERRFEAARRRARTPGRRAARRPSPLTAQSEAKDPTAIARHWPMSGAVRVPSATPLKRGVRWHREQGRADSDALRMGTSAWTPKPAVDVTPSRFRSSAAEHTEDSSLSDYGATAAAKRLR